MEFGLFLDFWLSEIELLCILYMVYSGAPTVISFELIFRSEMVGACLGVSLVLLETVHMFFKVVIIF